VYLKNVINKQSKVSLAIYLILYLTSCKEKDTVFEITDLTKEQRFTYVTHTLHGITNKEITMEGEINGCVEIAYFYLAPYNFDIENRKEWPKHTIMFKDSVSYKFQTEEGDKTKHQFVFLPGDATEGKITIRIHTP
jgi:hypothetical protein